MNGYPVPGRRIAPKCLAHLLRIPIPERIADDDLLQSLDLADLDEAVWELYSLHMCKSFAYAIRDRIVTFAQRKDPALLSVPLPVTSPEVSLQGLDLSSRTYSRLKRFQFDPSGISGRSPLTVEAVLSIRHFGVTSLLELITALEQYELDREIHKFSTPISSVSPARHGRKPHPSDLATSIQELVTEVRSVVDIDLVTLTDPRLGHRLQALSLAYSLSGNTFEELADEILELIESYEYLPMGYLSKVLTALLTDLQSMQQLTLESELREILTAVTSGRNYEITAYRLGWDGRGGATLQSTAERFKISRERVRQICKQPVDVLVKSTVYAPVLDRCLAFINKCAPISYREAEDELLRHRFVGMAFKLGGIIEGAKIFARELPFEVTGRDNDRLISSESQEWVRTLSTLTRRAVGKYGAITVDQVADMTEAELDIQLNHDEVRRFLASRSDFSWLDQDSGWFWLTSIPDGRNRLINQIRKILAVAGSINVQELRSGVSRHHRSGGIAPPRRVLLELCQQLQWCNVIDDVIFADPPIEWQKVLGKVERVLVKTLRQNGSIMSRVKLEECCSYEGIPRSTFYVYIGYSPIIVRYSRGVYGLRGASVEPGIVDSLRPKFRQREVLQDYGWLNNQRVWLGYRISEGMISNGVVSIPSALSSYLQGEYIISAADGAVSGRLVCRANTGWGLGPVFRKLGAEPDDALLIVIDSSNGETTVQIGDGSLIDDYREL